ncbi:MAG: phosphoadenosine phosphosulfate reductase family protein, partial [Planctomycetales bacterium]|nr:phosphoadenosine phosphosulfate reductase family protein [Planctomycetales bacterium]
MPSLEAESIHILRELAAELDNLVLLYSIGEDSSVILHLSLRAFYPSKPAFPLLHIDSNWEFCEMIEFRAQYARQELGLDVIAYVNEDGIAEGINPFDHGSKVDTGVMRTPPLKQALTNGFDGAIGGGRATKSDRGRRNVSVRSALGNIAGTCA